VDWPRLLDERNFGIGIIVANVPEGLLPTVTLALAMSSQRMAKRKALVKHLPSVETLGCTTVICTDKTGTLTENRMTVDRFYADHLVVESNESSFSTGGRVISTDEAEQWRPLFDDLLHCHNAKQIRQPDGRFVLTGDPTEVALLQFAIDHGLAHKPSFRRMGELAFDADRKRMSTLHWVEGRLTAFVKGAPEAMLECCSHILIRGQAEVMSADERRRILIKSRSFAEQAYRLLAVASREVVHQPPHIEVETIETDLTFLGLSHDRSTASRSTYRHRNLPSGWYPCGDDHRRPCTHRSGDWTEDRTGVRVRRWSARRCSGD
jgi:sodium/potassium-transporting ATPase subunit alpha